MSRVAQIVKFLVFVEKTKKHRIPSILNGIINSYSISLFVQDLQVDSMHESFY